METADRIPLKSIPLVRLRGQLHLVPASRCTASPSSIRATLPRCCGISQRPATAPLRHPGHPPPRRPHRRHRRTARPPSRPCLRTGGRRHRRNVTTRSPAAIASPLPATRYRIRGPRRRRPYAGSCRLLSPRHTVLWRHPVRLRLRPALRRYPGRVARRADENRPPAATTLIYCAHEYTASGIRFAAATEPDNPAVADRAVRVTERLGRGLPTVPFTLADDLATNPFLRCRAPGVIAAASARLGRKTGSDLEVFTALRVWRDSF